VFFQDSLKASPHDSFTPVLRRGPQAGMLTLQPNVTDLYIGTHFKHGSGVWAVTLGSLHKGEPVKRKWYGTLAHTTAAHLTLHAILEGLARLKRQGQHAVIHTVPFQHPLLDGNPHAFSFGEPQGMASDLSTLHAPPISTRRLPPGSVPVDVPVLNQQGLQTVMARVGAEVQLGRAGVNFSGLLVVPDQRYAASIELAPNGLAVPGSALRELLMRERSESRSLPDCTAGGPHA